MARQKGIPEVVKAVDGEFTDIQLVEKINELRQDKKRVTNALKTVIETLAGRLIERGVSEATVGDQLVIIGPQFLTEYDQGDLASLKHCVTEEQIWLTFKQLPSDKQLKALSELGGASAKAVIDSARRKIETDNIVLKIKKPRASRDGRR